MKADLAHLCKVISYHFNDISLLDSALRHRSVSAKNNERLEFLGDSIINYLIAEMLYTRCPQASEGELSRQRANLVKGQTLAQLAQEFNLGDYLRLGSGELKSGGYRRESILADALEAIVAAIYLDSNSDMDVCRACVLKWYGERLDNISAEKVIKDPKSRLQEYLQSRKINVPTYHVISVAGEAHAQIFYVECKVKQLNYKAQASGSNRRRAEQAAAEQILELIAQSGV